jgi:VanZ family protein
LLFRHLKPAVIWAIFILVLCSIPGKQLPETPFWDLLAFDKTAHMAVFLVFAVLLKVSFLKQHQFAVLRYYVNRVTLMVAIGYGVAIEILQNTLFTDRFADVNDMIANAIGAVLGLLIFKLIYANCINNK